MIDIIVADHQELFHVGMAEILAGSDDIFLIGQPRSPDQLLEVLQTVIPHVLVLSTSFLPAFSKIQPMLKRQTALLLLAEENDDRASYVRWLRAQGIVYRSMDRPVIIEAMRRVARGELFVQDRSSDIRKDPPEVA
jgi:DNA-binding NarL/FixJ family response regulator